MRKVMLLDNNLLASPNWRDVMRDVWFWRLKICFSQGLDIRLVDPEVAWWLRRIRYADDQFRRPRLYFAFDTLGVEDAVVKGVALLKRSGIPPDHLMFYMLVGFGEGRHPMRSEDYTWDYFLEHDYYRFEILKELGVLPYVMLYNDRRDIPLLRHFERWVNYRLYHIVPLERYDSHFRRKRRKVKTKVTL